MATHSRIGQVYHLLDEAQLAREDLHGQVQSARTLVLRLRHMSRELYDELLDIERELAGPDEQHEGGTLFTGLSDLRNHKAIRKAKPWDGSDRRRTKKWTGEERRHLRAVA